MFFRLVKSLELMASLKINYQLLKSTLFNLLFAETGELQLFV